VGGPEGPSCFGVWWRNGRRKPGTEVCQSVEEEELDAALRRQAEQRKYIGELLCQSGHIRPADIAEALEIQKSYGLA